jgi:hypothetical protein
MARKQNKKTRKSQDAQALEEERVPPSPEPSPQVEEEEEEEEEEGGEEEDSSSDDDEERSKQEASKKRKASSSKVKKHPVASSPSVASVTHHDTSVTPFQKNRDKDSTPKSVGGQSYKDDVSELLPSEKPLTTFLFMKDKPIADPIRDMSMEMMSIIRCSVQFNIFKRMKFYRDETDADPLVGWVLHRCGYQDKDSLLESWWRAKYWNIVRDLVIKLTRDEVQVCVGKFYTVVRGKCISLRQIMFYSFSLILYSFSFV